ncbi:MAG TPA: YncE family protein [Planctomycetota bacterium]|nr:YncE family protein [Planctomycetota bacterium]
MVSVRKILWRLAFVLSVGVLAGTAPADARERANPEPGPSGYHLLKKVPLDGEEGWDYLSLDPVGRRLYISRENRVLVFDLATETAAGEVRGLSGAHGIAIAADLGRGFATSGKDGSCVIFDLKSLKPVGQVKTGKGPDAILFDPASKRVFAFNGGSDSASVIDAASGMLAGTVSLGGAPEFGVADAAGRVYVNIEDKNQIVVIDSRKLSVVARWSLGTGQKPTGLAIDRKNRRLFSTCRDSKTMVVLDADLGKVLTSLPIGSGVDAAEYDPETALAIASNGDSTMTVVHEESPAKFTVLESVQTGGGAKTMALDPKTHRVYLVSSDPGKAKKEVFLLIYEKQG